LHEHRAAVAFDNVTNEGKAETRSLDVSIVIGLDPIEAIKDPRLFFNRDAKTEVANRDHGMRTVASDG
jgi:hypothetical protein